LWRGVVNIKHFCNSSHLGIPLPVFPNLPWPLTSLPAEGVHIPGADERSLAYW
jgi:hypothetical protein